MSVALTVSDLLLESALCVTLDFHIRMWRAYIFFLFLFVCLVSFPVVFTVKHFPASTPSPLVFLLSRF